MAPKPLTVGSVTVGRSDYGIYLPIYRRILSDPALRLHLIVTGAHLAPQFGDTVRVIEGDGIPIDDRVEMPLDSDTPAAIAACMGAGVRGLGEAYARARPDLLLLLGDRYEMLAAAVAALPFNIPIAHVHGGESTLGAMDELIRHAITKMSHVHFASTEVYARRIVQMGEPPQRVIVSGAPALDNLRGFVPLTLEQLNAEHGLKLTTPFLLVSFHPVTLEHHDTGPQVAELLAGLAAAGLPALITYPNADTASQTIIAALRAFVAARSQHQIVANLGTRGYFSAMSLASAMVGNSSSGIIEAASFGLPVVNVGRRQEGRLRAMNVIDVACERAAIAAAIAKATSRSFRDSLIDLKNPYGDGHASERIVATIKGLPAMEELLVKPFHDA